MPYAFGETIGVKTERCTGCRACEVACSFRLNRSFSSHASGIRIIRDNLTGEIAFKVGPACDMCMDRLEPACVEVCPMGAVVIRRAKLDLPAADADRGDSGSI